MQGNKFSPAQLRAMKAAGIDTKTLKEGIDPKGAARMDAAKGKKAETQDEKHKRLMLGKHSPAVKYAKMKKEEVEEVQISERERVLAELHKGRHGQSEKEYQDSRSDAGKMVSGDSKGSGAAYSSRSMKGTGPNPAGGSKRPEGQGRMTSGARTDLQFRKAALKKKNEEVEYVEEERANVRQNGNIYIVGFTWLGKYMIIKLFFPEVKRPSRKEAQVALEKIYPGAKIQRFDQAPYNPSEPMLYMGVQEETELQEKKDKDTPDQVKAVIAFDKARKGTDDATYDSEHGEKKKAKKERDYAKWQRDKGQEDAQKSGHRWKHAKGSTREKEGKKSVKDKYIKDSYESDEKKNLAEKSAAWQRKEGKNKTGGLNEKGRKSYERENPGSDLKAPQPEGGPRKRSFCARMGGVKGPMKKPNGEPTRKALALRKWKC